MSKEQHPIAFSDDEYTAQAYYSNAVLSAYDFVVFRIFSTHVWKCPAATIVRGLSQSLTDNHCDMGVGTGYFLDKATFDPASRIWLVDANRNCLRRAERRIARYSPSSLQANLMNPLGWKDRRFDSISLIHLLHVLPGPLERKAVVFDNVLDLANDGARVFGATILSDGVQHTRMATRIMKTFNKRGIFGNENDSRDQLEQELGKRFSSVELETVGSVGLFSGRV